MNNTDTKVIVDRLLRIEARMVRGFDELGVRVIDDEDWFRVDLDRRKVYVKTSGKSLSAVWKAMRDAGCVAGVPYELTVNGEVVAPEFYTRARV